MKKILIFLLLISFITVAYATPLRNNTYYYYDQATGFYLYDDGTTQLDGGTTIANATATEDGGWDRSGTGAGSYYDNTYTYEGNYSISMVETVTNLITMTSNNTFNGEARIKIYVPVSIGTGYASGFNTIDGSYTNQASVSVYPSQDGTNWYCAGIYGAGCTNLVPITFDAWHEIVINYTGTQACAYVDEVLLECANTNLGLGYIRLINHDIAPGTKTIYYDDFMVCHTSPCPTETPPADVPNIDIKLFSDTGTIIPYPNSNNYFHIKANYSLLGQTLTDGVCNFTALNVSAVFYYNGSFNSTLNNTGQSLDLGINEDVSANWYNDSYNFRICRGSLPINVSLLINGTKIKGISNVIPSCTNGYHEERGQTAFYPFKVLNFSVKCIDCGNPNQWVKIVSNNNRLLNYERAFSSHFEEMPFNTPYYEYINHFYTFPLNHSSITVKCNDTTKTNIYTITGGKPSINILSLNNYTYTDGIKIESTENVTALIDVFGGLITYINFNATNSTGGLIKNSTTEFLFLDNNDMPLGNIYLSAYAVTNFGNYTVKTGYFIYNDTIQPSINFISPLESNTSIAYFNESYTVEIIFSDINYYGREILIYDSIGSLKYNFTQTGITGSYEDFTSNIVPDKLGNWTINVMAVDSHTSKKIPVYNVDKSNISRLSFDFDDKHADKKLKTENKKVLIDYVTGDEISEWITIKEKDRVKFGFKFKNKNHNPTQNLKLKVQCAGIDYIEDSKYTAHFVCMDTLNWVDFVTDDLLSYSVKECGKDCFMLDMELKTKDEIIFNSIGGLNVNYKSVSFSVQHSATSKVNLFTNFPLDNIPNVLVLFMIIILYISCLLIGFMFRNTVFISFAFFLGLVMGLVLAQLHIFLTLLMFLLNIFILLRGLKGKD